MILISVHSLMVVDGRFIGNRKVRTLLLEINLASTTSVMYAGKVMKKRSGNGSSVVG